MAKETNLSDIIFLGTDHSLVFHVKNDGETASIDIAGQALSFMLKTSLSDLDAAALLTKTTGGGGISIAGTFNSNPSLNLQRATVTIVDTNTDALAEGTRYFELKRTDDGQETVYAYGALRFQRGVHRT